MVCLIEKLLFWWRIVSNAKLSCQRFIHIGSYLLYWVRSWYPWGRFESENSRPESMFVLYTLKRRETENSVFPSLRSNATVSSRAPCSRLAYRRQLVSSSVCSAWQQLDTSGAPCIVSFCIHVFVYGKITINLCLKKWCFRWAHCRLVFKVIFRRLNLHVLCFSLKLD